MVATAKFDSCLRFSHPVVNVVRASIRDALCCFYVVLAAAACMIQSWRTSNVECWWWSQDFYFNSIWWKFCIPVGLACVNLFARW